jgi:hypothetical protein
LSYLRRQVLRNIKLFNEFSYFSESCLRRNDGVFVFKGVIFFSKIFLNPYVNTWSFPRPAFQRVK